MDNNDYEHLSEDELIARDLATDRECEIAKYRAIYRDVPEYGMSVRRLTDTASKISGVRGYSIVDIGCGRGEMLAHYRDRGFKVVRGTETIDLLCDGEIVVNAMAHALPFDNDEFEWATCFDVIEHLVPGDEINLFDEMDRIATVGIAFSINNKDSKSLGEQLHINIKDYKNWNNLVQVRYSNSEVAYYSNCFSPIWVVRF